MAEWMVLMVVVILITGVVSMMLGCEVGKRKTSIPDTMRTSACLLEMAPRGRETIGAARTDVVSLRDAVQSGQTISGEDMDGVLALVSMAERVQQCLDRPPR